MISVGISGRIQDSVCQISSSGSSVPRGVESLVVCWMVQDSVFGQLVLVVDLAHLEGNSVSSGSNPAKKKEFVPEELFLDFFC